MNIPEKAPTISEMNDSNFSFTADTLRYAAEYNQRYLHWSELKYKEFGDSNREDIWLYMKITRNLIGKRFSIGDLSFSYVINDDFQRMLHEIDVKISSGLFPDANRSEKEKLSIAISSMMEESITSSQMEGASTTAKLAKKILRTNTAPADRSQKMIVNNYHAMQFIKRNTDVPLTPGLIKEIHSVISDGTLNDPADEGRFRTDNSIAIRGTYEDVTYYEPVDHKMIDTMVEDLCSFVNDDKKYIHPIVKGIILHFMMSYIHPFIDGNGRVARCMFYWYAIKNGYSLVEYLSISKVIKSHRQKYDLAYLLTETDENDITYFIGYNLERILESIDIFVKYLERKTAENKELMSALSEHDLTVRQRAILDEMIKDDEPISVYDLISVYQTSSASIRRDLLKLEEYGLLRSAGKDRHKQLYVLNKEVLKGHYNFSFEKK